MRARPFESRSDSRKAKRGCCVATFVTEDEILRRYKFEFVRGQVDRSARTLDAIEKILLHLRKPGLERRELLQEAADLVSKHLRIREVTIGLRNPIDGLYSYEVMTGLSEESWAAHKQLTFTNEQFFDDSTYKGRQLTKHTKLFLAESNPYAPGEEGTYSRPLMLKSTRRTVDDSVEGDYVDTIISGADDKPIGWIECSGTNAWKLPDAMTIRWI